MNFLPHNDAVCSTVREMTRVNGRRLQKFKALPVDGLHPKQTTVIYAGNTMTGPQPDSWLTAALQTMGTMANVDGAVADGCKKSNPVRFVRLFVAYFWPCPLCQSASLGSPSGCYLLRRAQAGSVST